MNFSGKLILAVVVFLGGCVAPGAPLALHNSSQKNAAAMPLAVSTTASGLQSALTKASTTGSPVSFTGKIVYDKPLTVPTGIEFFGASPDAELIYTGADVAMYFVGSEYIGVRWHDMRVTAKKARAIFDFNQGAQDYDLENLRLECGGTHLWLRPKGDGYAYFFRINRVWCSGTGPIMDYVGRESSVSHLEAVNNHFGPNVEAMVTIRESPVIHQLSTIHFVTGNRLESSAGIPLMKIMNGWNYVHVSGMWWEQAIQSNPDGTRKIIPKITVDGHSVLDTRYVSQMNASQPVILTNGGEVIYGSTPLVLTETGVPLSPANVDTQHPERDFGTQAAKAITGDGTSQMKYLGGVIKANPVQPVN